MSQPENHTQEQLWTDYLNLEKGLLSKFYILAIKYKLLLLIRVLYCYVVTKWNLNNHIHAFTCVLPADIL